MNAERRKELSKIWDQLDELKNQIDFLAEAEDEAYNNMPESLQGSERGERMCEIVESLESASSSLDDVISYIQEAVES